MYLITTKIKSITDDKLAFSNLDTSYYPSSVSRGYIKLENIKRFFKYTLKKELPEVITDSCMETDLKLDLAFKFLKEEGYTAEYTIKRKI